MHPSTWSNKIGQSSTRAEMSEDEVVGNDLGVSWWAATPLTSTPELQTISNEEILLMYTNLKERLGLT